MFLPHQTARIRREHTGKVSKSIQGIGKITREQIQDQIKKTKPFKAPGPDGIPN